MLLTALADLLVTREGTAQAANVSNAVSSITCASLRHRHRIARGRPSRVSVVEQVAELVLALGIGSSEAQAAAVTRGVTGRRCSARALPPDQVHSRLPL